MIGELLYAKHWWVWWSNPVLGIHDDHRYRAALTPTDFEHLDYFRLLDIRSQLELSEVPDDSLVENLEIRCLALSDAASIESRLTRFAVLTMSSTILSANAAEWNEYYGVSSPELIKELVRQRAELPNEILYWQEPFSRSLANSLTTNLSMLDRTRLGLCMVLRTYFPKIMGRWSLTCPRAVTEFANSLESMPEDKFEFLKAWSWGQLQELDQDTRARFEVRDFSFEVDTDLESQISDFLDEDVEGSINA